MRCANLATFVIGLLVTAMPASAETLVQNGNLSGGIGPGQFHNILLDQFDPGLGALNSVQLDFLTSVIGGATTTGSGEPVHIIAQLDADYFIGLQQIANTQALVDTIIPNTGTPTSFSVFNTDTEQVVYDDPPALAPWIGTGEILMRAFVEFMILEDPPILGFGAGGTVTYTVTYDYTVIPTDINGDGTVNVDDLIEVILAWGPCPGSPAPCPADVNGSTIVDVDDLVAVILSWS